MTKGGHEPTTKLSLSGLSILATCRSCSSYCNKVTTCLCSVQVCLLTVPYIATNDFIG